MRKISAEIWEHKNGAGAGEGARLFAWCAWRVYVSNGH